MEYVTSPAYIFDIDHLQNKVRDMKRALTHCDYLCFAMKANPFLVGSLKNVIDRFEVCSPGEYEICNAREVDSEQIIVSGVNKTKESMERIFDLNQGNAIFTIESELHYEILSKIASQRNICIHVMIRLSSGNQFGVDKETLERIAERISKDDHVVLQGIHYFSGTQKKMKKIKKELAMLEEFGIELKEKFGNSELELEYGPGLAVAYFEGDKVDSPEEQLAQLNEELGKITAFYKIGIEMGRFIAASCGQFLTKVIDIKRTEESNYVILDSGIHQIHYFGQMMGMKHPVIRQLNKRENAKKEKYILCGSLCTVNDVMVRDIELETLEIGDELLFGMCGAYSMTEGSALFLSRELPAVYEYDKTGMYKCIREKSETYIFNTDDKKGEF